MDDNTDDIQAQILQTTLTEIETSRQEGADSTAAGSDESHDCCVICLDSISDACAALPCGHTHFDFLCLVSWLQEHPNCPLCKANVYKVRYADAQKGDAVYRVPNASKTRDNTGRDENAPNRTGQTHLNSASRRYSFHNGLLRDTTRRIPRPPPSPNEAIQRRRHIYRHQLYSLREHAPLPPASPRPASHTANTSQRHRLEPHFPVPATAHPRPTRLHPTPHLARPPLDPPRAPSLFLPLRPRRVLQQQQQQGRPHPANPHRQLLLLPSPPPPPQQRRVPPRVHRRHPQDGRPPGQRRPGREHAGRLPRPPARPPVPARAAELAAEPRCLAGRLGPGGAVPRSRSRSRSRFLQAPGGG